MDLDRAHYRAIPVGTDEDTFRPRPRPVRTADDDFTVLYYGSMLPLHGLDRVLDAAVRLRERSDIRFEIVGGDGETAALVAAAGEKGAHVAYRQWVDYDALPQLFAECDLFLAGPFGNSVQAQHVITGKAYQFLCAGLPTVVGANRETDVFTDGVNSLVVPQGNAAALAEAVGWASAHPEELAAIGREGRRLYEARFSVKEIAVLLDEIPWDAPAERS
jgi:glycosyltransferase involved in cell wall biosynthesis